MFRWPSFIRWTRAGTAWAVAVFALLWSAAAQAVPVLHVTFAAGVQAVPLAGAAAAAMDW